MKYNLGQYLYFIEGNFCKKCFVSKLHTTPICKEFWYTVIVDGENRETLLCESSLFVTIEECIEAKVDSYASRINNMQDLFFFPLTNDLIENTWKRKAYTKRVKELAGINL